jgi:hypothetical protein
MSRYQPTYFKYSEFDSPDAPGSGIQMKDEFLIMLDNARKIAGIPFVIVSGFRTRARQLHIIERLPGRAAQNSAHELGLAADIRANSMKDARTILESCFKAGFRRFGIMATSIHVDCDNSRPTPSCYTYSDTPKKRYSELKALFDKLIEDKAAAAAAQKNTEHTTITDDIPVSLDVQSDINWEFLAADLVQFVKQWTKEHDYLLVKAKKYDSN